MSDPKCTHISTNEDILSRLPHTITKGVTATREGLVFDRQNVSQPLGDADLRIFSAWEVNTEQGLYRVRWPDAAERLRYREGEPWCQVVYKNLYFGGCDDGPCSDIPVLHRVASLLCDDAESFTILHWCVRNLQGVDSE
jgi:hypothetical protein